MAYNPLAFGLMLVGTGALVFSAYLYREFKRKMEHKEEQTFGAMFIIVGAVASIFGFGIFFSQPIPGQYIEVYGVGYLMYTMLMIIGGLCMIFGWDKKPASYMAAVGGVILLGSAYTVLSYSLSKSPLSTTVLFALSGLGSMTTLILTHSKDEKLLRPVVLIAIAIFAIVGCLALYSGLAAQSGHVGSALAAAV